MKKVLFVILFFMILSVMCGQKNKIAVSYKQPEVYVVVDEKLIGESPKTIKVNFALSSEIYFFKKGYYTHKIELDADNEFNKITVDLTKKPKSAKAQEKFFIVPEKLVISKTVTNMTEKDIQEIIDENFIENNFFIGKSIDMFPDAKSEIKNSRYKLAIEVIDNKQVRMVYKAPRFMMAYIKLRWSLLDNKTNKVVYFDSTEGIYFVKIQTHKGLKVSEMMIKVMEGAIDEAQFKLLTQKKFIDIISEN